MSQNILLQNILQRKRCPLQNFSAGKNRITGKSPGKGFVQSNSVSVIISQFRTINIYTDYPALRRKRWVKATGNTGYLKKIAIFSGVILYTFLHYFFYLFSGKL